jgi:serine/threonine-protein kinase HipA
MTMLEASDGEQRSYLEIAEVIETTWAHATDELHQLWRRIVFSVLVSNTNYHLRNHGFLHERGDVWRLSPAFDLNPNPDPGPKYLSTSIDGGDDVASVDAALGVADYFGLHDAEAEQILSEVIAAVRQWRTVAASHQLSATEIRAMEPAFVALHETAEA